MDAYHMLLQLFQVVMQWLVARLADSFNCAAAFVS
jgi:hypothetical protein